MPSFDTPLKSKKHVAKPNNRMKSDPKAAAQARARAIAGDEEPTPTPAYPPDAMIAIQRMHGTHWMRLSLISQLIYDVGQLQGPFFVRCDGQQLPISEAEAAKLAKAMNITLPKL